MAIEGSAIGSETSPLPWVTVKLPRFRQPSGELPGPVLTGPPSAVPGRVCTVTW
jgi:hypothetical protein